MKITHIFGGEVSPSNGIGRLLPEMIEQSNIHSKLFEHSLLCTGTKFETNKFTVYGCSNFDSSLIDSTDLFIFHGIYFYEYLSMAKKILAAGKKYMIKPHSSLMHEAQKKSWLKKWFANHLFFKKFVRSSSCLLFINEEERGKSFHWGNTSSIDKNGILPILSKKKSSPKSSYGSKVHFVYLSRIDFHHKGTDILLEAFEYLAKRSELNSIDLSIYGVGDEASINRLNSYLLKINHPNIKFLGPLYGVHKYEILANMDIFILTSRYEGFPMAVLEALEIGLPCLVTEGVNMSTILENYNLGWECRPNIHDIAEKILEVSKLDNSVIDAMSHVAQDYVAKNHYWPDVVRSNEKQYVDVR